MLKLALKDLSLRGASRVGCTVLWSSAGIFYAPRFLFADVAEDVRHSLGLSTSLLMRTVDMSEKGGLYIGPRLGAEHLWSDSTNNRGLFSVAFVARWIGFDSTMGRGLFGH